MAWGTPVEVERRRRVRVAAWAYAYEVLGEQLATDAEFDRECALVDVSVRTGRDDLDAWFALEFEPYTGSWVHRHPEQDRLRDLCLRLLGRAR